MIPAKLQIGSVKYNCLAPEEAFGEQNKVIVHNGYLNIHLYSLLRIGKGATKDIEVRVSCCEKCSRYKRHTIEMESSKASTILKTLRKQNGRGNDGTHQVIELEKVIK